MPLSISTNTSAMSARQAIEDSARMAAKAQRELATGSKIADPSDDPSAAAVSSVLTSSISALRQASSNGVQASSLVQLATGALKSTTDVLNRMATLAAQANSDSIDDSARQMLDKEFQCLKNQVDLNARVKWGNVSLFAGSTNGTVAVAAAGAAVTASAAVANAFQANVGINGFVSGSVTNIDVIDNPANASYAVSVTIGGQIFSNNNATPNVGGTLVLKNAADTSNTITLTYDAASVSGISSAETFSSAIKNALNAPISSATAAFNAGFSVTADSGARAGNYGVEYTRQTGRVELWDGTNHFVYVLPQMARTTNQTQNITFSNGITLRMNAFDATADQALALFTVTPAGNGTNTMIFQIGQASSDTLSMQFNSATTGALGLGSAGVSTKSAAAASNTVINSALTSINNQIASLGAKKSQLSYLNQNLATSVQNQEAAKATFSDSDLTDTLMRVQKFDAQQKMAVAAFQKALQRDADLARMVESAVR